MKTTESWLRSMGEYKDLRTLFHISEADADKIYRERFASKDAMRLGFNVSGSEAFYVMNSGVYELILKAERLDKKIAELQRALPPNAIEQYVNKCLIDEIVLTNEIEGVHSSRQEIGDVLARLERNDKRGRFQGIVEKYSALSEGRDVPLKTCEDVRRLYDELVLSEVVRENADNAPDGRLFRAGSTHVVNESGIAIHDGVEPEDKIIELLDKALRLLSDDGIEVIVRVSLFHFMFAYIHPFYDGNGRTNRFISSYVLSRAFSPLPGLRLSYAVKEHIQSYYKAFAVCEHPLNKGDITPFVMAFAKIIVEAMESMCASLSEKRIALNNAMESLDVLLKGTKGDEKRDKALHMLIQAGLFSELGITAKELARVVGVSVPTIYGKLRVFEGEGLIRRTRRGHGVYLSMDIDRLLETSPAGE